jgi:hypothetical protein
MIEVSECKVSLWFVGDQLQPSAITHRLGRTPSYSIRRGETYLSKRGEEMVASTGRWTLTTGWQTGRRLEELVGELLAQLPADPDLWAALTSEHASQLFCGLLLGSFNEETRFSAATLAAISSRGLALHLDIYDSDEAVPPELAGAGISD